MSATGTQAVWFLEAELDEPQLLKTTCGEVAVLTRRSPGKTATNQDAVLVLPVGSDRLVLAVADGMGGHADGEKAARTCLEAVARHLDGAVAPLRHAILDGIESGHRAVFGLPSDAGTTLILTEIGPDHVRCYHVGDSSALLTGQRGKLKLQTVAHSPTGYAVEAGLLDEEEALAHADRHLVLNAIGLDGMHIELGAQHALAKRDTLVLASDGLTDNLSTDEIIEAVRKGSLKHAAGRLADVATERMSGAEVDRPSKPDDLTLVVFRPA